MKRMIIIVVLIIVTVGAMVAYRMYSMETADVVNAKPDVETTASALISEFEKDSAAATAKYMDKIVLLSGPLKKIDTTGTLVLGEEGTASEVVVGLDRRHMNDHAGLVIGKNITVQGRCSGYSKSSGDPDDMLASLGSTVELKMSGVKNK
jgi:hypothetical protein